MVHNLMRELERRDPRMQSIKRNLSNQADEDAGPLIATEPIASFMTNGTYFRTRIETAGAGSGKKP
jgi:hypothetical protein